MGVGVIETAQSSRIDYSARLTQARLIALNRQGRVSNFVPPINSLILIGMLWGEESPALLLIWAGLVWASSGWRIGLYRAFDRAVARGEGHAERWKMLSIGSYGLSGAVWGIGSFLMFPQDSFLVQAFLMVFVLGMGAGGTASFAPYFPALLAYVVPLTLPVTIILVLQDSSPHILLGVGGFIFLLALVFLGRAGSRSFMESFRLGFENESLASELTAAQTRLEGALDSMSEAFALFDADHCLVECNNRFDDLLPEFENEIASGISFEEFFVRLGESGRIPASVGRSREWAEEIIAWCQTPDLPLEIEMAEGRWLMLNTADTSDGGIVTTFSDISEIKRHELIISGSEQRYRDFTSSASDWVWELDAESRFAHVSGRYSEVSGRSAESMIGKKIHDQPLPHKQPDWNRLISAIELREPFRNVRVVRSRDNGEVYHFVLNGLPIYGPSAEFLGYRGTGSDITAMVEAETRAKLAQTQLFEAIESIPAGFVLFDALGRLTLWNSRAPLYLPGASALIVAGALSKR